MIRLTSTIAMLVLVGCSAVPSAPTHMQTQGAAIKASGGSFSASYSGTWTARNFPCEEPPLPGSFTFNGNGSGSFIHMSGEHIFFIGCTVPWHGTATLTSSRFPNNSITATVDHVLARSNPCDAFGRHVDFTVTGGTGRFASATGSGTIAITCHGNTSGTYTDQWSGTITF